MDIDAILKMKHEIDLIILTTVKEADRGRVTGILAADAINQLKNLIFIDSKNRDLVEQFVANFLVLDLQDHSTQNGGPISQYLARHVRTQNTGLARLEGLLTQSVSESVEGKET